MVGPSQDGGSEGWLGAAPELPFLLHCLFQIQAGDVGRQVKGLSDRSSRDEARGRGQGRVALPPRGPLGSTLNTSLPGAG